MFHIFWKFQHCRSNDRFIMNFWKCATRSTKIRIFHRIAKLCRRETCFWTSFRRGIRKWRELKSISSDSKVDIFRRRQNHGPTNLLFVVVHIWKQFVDILITSLSCVTNFTNVDHLSTELRLTQEYAQLMCVVHWNSLPRSWDTVFH